jgi:hypothetical protein
VIGGGCWTFGLKYVLGIDARCDPAEEGDRSVKGDSVEVGMGIFISSGTEV